jgi:hypothetical protein
MWGRRHVEMKWPLCLFIRKQSHGKPTGLAFGCLTEGQDSPTYQLCNLKLVLCTRGLQEWKKRVTKGGTCSLSLNIHHRFHASMWAMIDSTFINKR